MHNAKAIRLILEAEDSFAEQGEADDTAFTAVQYAKLSRTLFAHRNSMATQKLTVRLPAGDIVFLKGYARQHDIMVTEALHRYLCRLREIERADIHPEVSRFTGLVPSDVEATEASAAHLEEKHR